MSAQLAGNAASGLNDAMTNLFTVMSEGLDLEQERIALQRRGRELQQEQDDIAAIVSDNGILDDLVFEPIAQVHDSYVYRAPVTRTPTELARYIDEFVNSVGEDELDLDEDEESFDVGGFAGVRVRYSDALAQDQIAIVSTDLSALEDRIAASITGRVEGRASSGPENLQQIARTGSIADHTDRVLSVTRRQQDAREFRIEDYESNELSIRTPIDTITIEHLQSLARSMGNTHGYDPAREADLSAMAAFETAQPAGVRTPDWGFAARYGGFAGMGVQGLMDQARQQELMQNQMKAALGKTYGTHEILPPRLKPWHQRQRDRIGVSEQQVAKWKHSQLKFFCSKNGITVRQNADDAEDMRRDIYDRMGWPWTMRKIHALAAKPYTHVVDTGSRKLRLRHKEVGHRSKK
jgi:hypothetical protein